MRRSTRRIVYKERERIGARRSRRSRLAPFAALRHGVRHASLFPYRANLAARSLPTATDPVVERSAAAARFFEQRQRAAARRSYAANVVSSLYLAIEEEYNRFLTIRQSVGTHFSTTLRVFCAREYRERFLPVATRQNTPGRVLLRDERFAFFFLSFSFFTCMRNASRRTTTLSAIAAGIRDASARDYIYIVEPRPCSRAFVQDQRFIVSFVDFFYVFLSFLLPFPFVRRIREETDNAHLLPTIAGFDLISDPGNTSSHVRAIGTRRGKAT